MLVELPDTVLAYVFNVVVLEVLELATIVLVRAVLDGMTDVLELETPVFMDKGLQKVALNIVVFVIGMSIIVLPK